MSMTRKEAIQYLEPIAQCACMKSYQEALTLALNALKEQEGVLAPVVEQVRRRYIAAKGSDKALLGEILELMGAMVCRM